MYTKEMYAFRIKLIALSQLDQMMSSVKENPFGYRMDTRHYIAAMRDVIENMTDERLHEIVDTVHESYIEQGMDDDGYVADSLLMVALAQYQIMTGEQNIYDLGWTGFVDDYFRTATA